MLHHASLPIVDGSRGKVCPPSQRRWVWSKDTLLLRLGYSITHTHRALKDYRVLLLDQRGTGLSSPILLQSLVSLSPTQQFDFLKLFRADSIVKDAEAIRQTLLGPQRKWTILGQSFGGFCLMTYLSFYPAMIEAGIFTGGIPPIGRSAEEVYTALGRRVAAMNARYYGE